MDAPSAWRVIGLTFHSLPERWEEDFRSTLETLHDRERQELIDYLGHLTSDAVTKLDRRLAWRLMEAPVVPRLKKSQDALLELYRDWLSKVPPPGVRPPTKPLIRGNRPRR